MNNGTIPTLASLAIGKGLPADWLRSLGVRDLPGGGVGIPYYSEDGGELLFERQRDVPCGPRFRHPAGVSLQPYGLWRLEDARRAGYLYLTEGESDTWAMWYLGLPSLGLPGAQTCRCLSAEHLLGIEVLYLVPDADSAGAALVAALLQHLAALGYPGQVYTIALPPGHKDVSDLFARDLDAALLWWGDLSQLATPCPLPQPARPEGSQPGNAARSSRPPAGEPKEGRGGISPHAPPSRRAAAIILEHLRAIYAPAFRRGERVWATSLPGEVRRTEALARACDSALMLALQDAAEITRDERGHIQPGAAPRLYRTWAPVAWADLLALLPVETETQEVEPTAERDFERRLSVALCRIITLAHHRAARSPQGDEQPEQQARSILDWCLCFARHSPSWQRLRSYYIWCRLADGGAERSGASDRHAALRVAIRPELLGQLGIADLAVLDYEQLADLVERYGLGGRCRAGKGGQRAIELSPRWLRALLTPPPAGDGGVTEGDRTTTAEDATP